jgi:hypothetical protein
MHAALVTVTIDPRHADQAEKALREQIIPMVGAAPWVPGGLLAGTRRRAGHIAGAVRHRGTGPPYRSALGGVADTGGDHRGRRVPGGHRFSVTSVALCEPAGHS